MKRIHFTFLLSALFMVMASAAQARFVFEPIATGARGGFSGIDRLWDAQPTITDLPADGSPGLIPAASGQGLGGDMGGDFANRIAVGYVDFGSDFSQVQIIELWTNYKASSGYDGSDPFMDLWWADSSTLTTFTDAGVTTVTKELANTTDITDPNFNFGTTGVANNSTNAIWMRDTVFSTAVVPERRFLMISSSMANNTATGFAISPSAGGGRASELAIVAIPEASSLMLGLVALGTVFLLKRRK